MSQFPLAERATEALGVTVWRMIEFEADDALAAFAARAAADPVVDQVVICSPDKDLRQCVRGSRVVCLDRMRRIVIDEAGVVEKFGVPPTFDSGLARARRRRRRWLSRRAALGCASSASTVLAHYGHIESIPDDVSKWKVNVRGAAALARKPSTASYRSRAVSRCWRRFARTCRLTETLEDLQWKGARCGTSSSRSARKLAMMRWWRVERWRDCDS